jgi:hypothetical protein
MQCSAGAAATTGSGQGNDVHTQIINLAERNKLGARIQPQATGTPQSFFVSPREKFDSRLTPE